MKLRNGVFVTLALLALVGCDKRQDPGNAGGARVTQGGSAAADPWNAPAPAKDPLKHPLLWKLEKDGKVSYVLGTMHVGIDPTTRLPDLVWQKLDEKPIFAMETDISGANLDVKRTDGKTLDEDLGPAYYKKLEDALGKNEAAMMKPLKPMIPATLLSLRKFPKTPPMDGVLHARATNAHKKLVYLEPIETQVVVLDKWMNVRALKDMLDDLDGTDARAKQMADAYIAGDGDKLMAVFDRERELWKQKGRPESEFDEQMDDLLFKRNASWIEPIEKLHAEGGGFIAVGAAHLLGPKSVLELLAARGFTITRVSP